MLCTIERRIGTSEQFAEFGKRRTGFRNADADRGIHALTGNLDADLFERRADTFRDANRLGHRAWQNGDELFAAKPPYDVAHAHILACGRSKQPQRIVADRVAKTVI